MSNIIFSGFPTAYASDYTVTGADQLETLGTLAQGNGRIYRYVKAGVGGVVSGKTVQAPAPVAAHQNIAVAAAAASGDFEVTVTLGATAATANQYAGGTLNINDAAGEGHTYIIESHPAAALSTNLVVTLAEPLVTALTTSSEASLNADTSNGVIVTPATPTSVVRGVGITDIAAGEYGWIVAVADQVACLADGAIAVGAAISASNAVAGAVESGVIAQGFVGNARQAGVDTEYRLVSINCL